MQVAALHRRVTFTAPVLFVLYILGSRLHFTESQCPNELPFPCSDRSACVSLEKLCDGAADCSDASDERGHCSTSCEGSGCQQACRRTPIGPMCYCNSGFYPSASNRSSCEDIDECLMWPPVCSQLCNNTSPLYHCSCAEGYELKENGHSCSVKSRVMAYLVYIHQSSLMRLELGPAGYSYPKLLVRSKGDIRALALDTALERVYYYDEAEQAIRRVDINGENIQDVITNGLMRVSALALDWVGRNLYVADDERKAVYACSLKNGLCVDLRLPQVYKPSSLVVDSTRRKLYWGDCGRQKIFSATLDGRDSIAEVEKDVICATSLFVDLPTNTLYWADISLQRIEAQQLNGARQRHTMSEVEQPMSVAVLEEVLYWTSLSIKRRSHDQMRGIILTASKYTASKPVSLGVELPELPYSMQLYHPTLQLREERSACDHQYCSDICLVTEAGFICACPSGHRLSADGQSCLERWDETSLILSHNNYLLRVLPDGVGAKTYDHLTALPPGSNITALAYDSVDKRVYVASGIISNDRRTFTSSISYFHLSDARTWHTLYHDVGHVTGLSVDWISRNIYWVDQSKRTIMVARLDGSAKVVLLQRQENIDAIDRPVTVAVDPIGKRLYFSDCGARPHIGMCGLTGNACTLAVPGETRDCVTDLKMDQQHKSLYWANQLRGSIAALNLEANEIQLIIPSPRPVGVALTSKNIYYTDSERQFGGLMYRSKGNHEMKYTILTGINPLGAIVSTESDLQPRKENVCSIGNGGCSDVCIASSDVHAVCLCAEDRKMSSDGKTCHPIARSSSDLYSATMEQSTMVLEHLPKRAASIERGVAASAASLYHHGVPLASLRISCLYNSQCLNGGTCVPRRADGSVCHCRENYTGSLCESLITISTTTTLALSTALYTSQSLSTSAVVALSVCLTALLCGAITGSFCCYRYYCSDRLGSCSGCSTALKVSHVESAAGDGLMQTVLYVPSTSSPLSYDNPGYVDPVELEYNDQASPETQHKDLGGSDKEVTSLTVTYSMESLYSTHNSRTELQSPIPRRQ